MTLSELEKLEALHAAATPGEWKGDRHDGTVKYRLHSENCECDREEPWNCPHLVLSVDHKNGTSGFRGVHSEENEKLVMALHNAFPDMARALREAWKEADRLRIENNDCGRALDFAVVQAREMRDTQRQLENERDEARDKIEGLEEDKLDAYVSAQLRGIKTVDYTGRTLTLVQLVSNMAHDLISLRAAYKDREFVRDSALAERDALKVRLDHAEADAEQAVSVLAHERDEALKKAKEWNALWSAEIDHANRYKRERDAARAEVEQLRKAEKAHYCDDCGQFNFSCECPA